MNGMDLFTGSGAFSLALRNTIPDYRTVCYVENDGYCTAQIVCRIADGHLDDAPVWDDIRTFDGRPWRGKVDIITAGFPCQPHSVAGQRKGEQDERNLWPDTARIIGEVRPRYALLENVAGIISNGYVWTVLADLAEIGYDTEWDVVSAAFVGAWHHRERLWLLVTDSESGRRDDSVQAQRRLSRAVAGVVRRTRDDWTDQSMPLGVAYAVPFRVDRLRTCGNGIVPQVVRRILQVSK